MIIENRGVYGAYYYFDGSFNYMSEVKTEQNIIVVR
jgi:hypothetical protein